MSAAIAERVIAREYRSSAQGQRRIRPEVIPEAVLHINPVEVNTISPNTDVLANVFRIGIDEPEAKAGLQLVYTVRKNTHIKTIAIMGPPGVGKSTIIEQFVQELFAQAEEEISVKVTSFDPAFQKMLKYVPREFWENVHWKFINDSLILSSKAKKKEKKSRRKQGLAEGVEVRSRRKLGPAREIEIVEVPFVGSTSDRGRTFVATKWQEACTQEIPESMLFVPLVAPCSQGKRVGNFREEIGNASGTAEQLLVLAKYGIEIALDVIHGMGKKVQDVIEETIRQVLQSASRRQMKAVIQDFHQELKDELPTLPHMFLQEFILLPYGVRFTHDEAYDLRRQAFYWAQKLDEMGVPFVQRYIFLNPALPCVRRLPLKHIAQD